MGYMADSLRLKRFAMTAGAVKDAQRHRRHGIDCRFALSACDLANRSSEQI